MFFRKKYYFIFSFLLIALFSSFERSVDPVYSNSHKDATHFDFFPQLEKNEYVVQHKAYALCYSESHEQAKWVAYKLTKQMCEHNEEERSDKFKADPLVTTGSALPDDYKKTGYDKGHLCPAGDMSWSEETMRESFYMSNMSPQLPAFNRGIWKNLESEVRIWAKQNSELYVVTAGVLEQDLPKIGTKNKVSVPEYFYKVILDYKEPGYKAIGFLMQNKGSKSPVLESAVPVDSIERVTGIDFFPHLPDSIESYVEAHIDTQLWKIEH